MKTAVGWLAKELLNKYHLKIDGYKEFQQAKEIEKQQQGYSKEDMIEASKYGYNFHKTTSFPQQDFEDSCVRNTQQWLLKFKNK